MLLNSITHSKKRRPSLLSLLHKPMITLFNQTNAINVPTNPIATQQVTSKQVSEFTQTEKPEINNTVYFRPNFEKGSLKK
jgi:hypothetical protein